jgi:hypothetical protein
MVTDQILQYIREQLAAGVSKESIKKALIEHHWTEEDITQAFATTEAPSKHTSVLKIVALSLATFLGFAIIGYGYLALAALTIIGGATSRASTFSYSHNDLNVSFSTDSASSTGLQFSISTDVDKSNPSQISSQLHIVGKGSGISFDGDLRLIGTSTYIRINSLPLLFGLGNEIFGKWIFISENDAKQFLGSTTPQKTLVSSSFSSNSFFQDGIAVLANPPTFVWDKNGLALRYSIVLDQDKVKDLLTRLYSEKKQSIVSSSTLASFSSALKDFQVGPIVYQVSLLNGAVDKIEIPSTFVFPDLFRAQLQSTSTAKSSSNAYHLLISVTSSDFNKPITISKPATSTQFAEILKELAPATATTSSKSFTQNADFTRYYDLKNLKDLIEQYSVDNDGGYPRSLSDFTEYGPTKIFFPAGIPTDPVTHKPYLYVINQADTSYVLCAGMSNSSYACVDPQAAQTVSWFWRESIDAPQSTWATFTDVDRAFSYTYPPKWEKGSTLPTGTVDYNLYASTNSIDTGEKQAAITLASLGAAKISYAPGTTPAQAMAKYIYSLKTTDDLADIVTTNTTFHGDPASFTTLRTVTKGQDLQGNTYFVSHNGQIYEIFFWERVRNVPLLTPIKKKFFDSFTFLNSAQSVSVNEPTVYPSATGATTYRNQITLPTDGSWSSYTVAASGTLNPSFSFKYPSSWSISPAGNYITFTTNTGGSTSLLFATYTPQEARRCSSDGRAAPW